MLAQNIAPAPLTSRGQHCRLGWHVSVLLGLSALPLVGLVVYFLSTGLHREIALAERERAGLVHVRQTVMVLQQAVRLGWSSDENDPTQMAALERSLTALDEVGASLALMVKPPLLPFQANNTVISSVDKVHAVWREVKAAPPGSAKRAANLREMVGHLHEMIFQTSDQSGLSDGAENEISAITDVVAVCLPLYVERLLQMHARMSSDLPTDGWDAANIESAAIFSQQIEEEDIKRVNRSVTAAVLADQHSNQISRSLQHDFPTQANALMAGMLELAGRIRPPVEGAAPALDPRAFDGILHTAFESAMTGWEAAIDQLDSLVIDQIESARGYRDRALFIAGGLFTLLLPVAWLYFRLYIRPVIESMVGVATEHRHLAKVAREAADDSIRRLRQTQSALDDHSAVMIVDLQHRIIAVNDRMCRISGYPREALLQQPFSVVAPATPEFERHPEKWDAIAQGKVWHGSLCHRANNGQPFWVDATLFPFLDREGKPAEFVVIETDVTELVQARKAAETAVKAKSQFLAMMSHEIRTPMNGVIGFAQLLADTKLDGQQRDYARTILTSGESLLVIINDILDFSKLEAGRTELEMRPVALRLLIEDVLDLLATQARAKNLELVYGIKADIPEGILADGPRLRQILLNLTGNAIKFTAKGYVEIDVGWAPTLENGTRCLTFHVRDTGIGIPEDRRDRLFKAFSQVDASVARTYGGTGLGLAISLRLVTLMGGKIAVTSVLGQGSDFHFTLPATEADVSEELHLRTVNTDDEVKRALRGCRVLIVDDLAPNRRLLETILARYGAVTVGAQGAAEALDALAREHFSLAVLDYLMPVANGIELARQIRRQSRWEKLPLLLVASAQPERIEKTEELFDTVILKPIRSQPFAAAAARALFRNSAVPITRPAAVLGQTTSFAADHPLRILVVDDNPINLKVISATLKALGYMPTALNDATLALSRLQKEQFDLILMDVQMPGMDGLEATRQLRAGTAGELNRRIRIIALTAGAMPEERAACLAAGMDDFMAKPVPRGELLEKLIRAGTRTVHPPHDQ